jgi:hypothetical protein
MAKGPPREVIVMGQGGHLVLVNGTSYDWSNTYQHSYQMNAWSFPATIAAGTSVAVYVEWSQDIFHVTSDDAGEVTYSLGGTGLNFQVQASAKNGFNLAVAFTNLATPGNPQGSTLNLGWNWNGYLNFVLSGQQGSLSSSNGPTAWMQTNLGILGSRILREICVPGSHDSGMSTFTSGTAFAHTCNVITQTSNIAGQLRLGARYFDIRPVISAGNYLTGHYSYIDQIQSWQGANGESIAAIIEDVNAYTAASAELVVLYVSHDLNTDLGNSAYAPFTQDEWNALLAQLQGLQNLYVAQNPTTVDLTMLTLNDYIGSGRGAVVVVIDPSGNGITLGSYANQGFYSPSNFPVYNSYSNTNNYDVMAADQLAKMKAQRTSPTSSYFLLSWTLTQDATQAVTCFLGVAESILDLAAIADPQLYVVLLPECTDQCYPNILYIDDVTTSDIAALAMAVNSK